MPISEFGHARLEELLQKFCEEQGHKAEVLGKSYSYIIDMSEP